MTSAAVWCENCPHSRTLHGQQHCYGAGPGLLGCPCPAFSAKGQPKTDTTDDEEYIVAVLDARYRIRKSDAEAAFLAMKEGRKVLGFTTTSGRKVTINPAMIGYIEQQDRAPANI